MEMANSRQIIAGTRGAFSVLSETDPTLFPGQNPHERSGKGARSDVMLNRRTFLTSAIAATLLPSTTRAGQFTGKIRKSLKWGMAQKAAQLLEGLG
jgi:hypothetical protein